MSDSQTIKSEISEGVARLTFARPKHNVFNIAMMQEFNAALESLNAEKDLKCVVILGEGSSWCAGVDVGDHRPELVNQMISTFNQALQSIEAIPVPVIAAVHGACLGGGMEFAIACDMVVAAQKAKFGQPEVKLGFFPPYAAIRLPALVGPAKAIEICATGRTYSADEAVSMGFVTRAVENEQFDAEIAKLVGEIQSSSPLILRLNKQAVKAHLGMNFPKAIESVSDLFLNTLMKTEDTLEGIASFYEKRKSIWKNK
ncbi:MAG: enoyl-CoA hydratase/isomerase family protein [Deltaproteobacteria bacterium]|nr:enoyl-CoA hydratase/isomerase family protein [Deltaproteobacteria bacterium]